MEDHASFGVYFVIKAFVIKLGFQAAKITALVKFGITSRHEFLGYESSGGIFNFNTFKKGPYTIVATKISFFKDSRLYGINACFYAVVIQVEVIIVVRCFISVTKEVVSEILGSKPSANVQVPIV